MARPPGPEFHTFSVLGRCPRTGMLGIATATRSLAVGARVPFVASGRGVVAIMAIADARLGFLALEMLRLGYRAQKVVDELVSSDPHHEYRQLAVVDNDGNSAARTGTHNRDWAGQLVKEGFVALGNVLMGDHVVEAIAQAFEANPEAALEERLMLSLEAGRDAGGQHGGQRSAALLVHDADQFARVDLRVDIHPEPVGELRKVFGQFKPYIDYYNLRQRDPRDVVPYHEFDPEHAP